jgi:hypothetical protein
VGARTEGTSRFTSPTLRSEVRENRRIASIIRIGLKSGK